MHGYHTQPVHGLGGTPTLLWGSFAPNGTDDPAVASNGGPPGLKAFTVTEADTGLFTLTLPEGLTPIGTPTICVSAQAADLTGYFEVMQEGAYNATTRSFAIRAKRANSGNAPAAAAGCRIHFIIAFNNSTGA